MSEYYDNRNTKILEYIDRCVISIYSNKKNLKIDKAVKYMARDDVRVKILYYCNKYDINSIHVKVSHLIIDHFKIILVKDCKSIAVIHCWPYREDECNVTCRLI